MRIMRPEPTPAPTGVQEWQRAVDLGAQGRAAAARRVLSTLTADPAVSPSVASLAHSTRASLLRQAGGHGPARVGDGRACLLAVGATRPSSGADGAADAGWLSAAWLDGLVGLAADNLGLGDFAASRRLLDRAAEHAAACSVLESADWRTAARTRLRLSWVRSEWGLYSGDLDTARAAAAASAELVDAVPSDRHRVKTDLIGAAVAAASGETEAAVAAGRGVYERAAAGGLLPLQWAAAALLSGVDGSAEYASDLAVLRDRLARRGMPLAPLSPLERHGR